MTPTKKCRHCDTMLEFEVDGRRWSFTAHDEVFCRDATRQRVQDLGRVLISTRESYEHAIGHMRRGFDEILTRHGLPSLADRARDAEREAIMLGLTPTSVMLFDNHDGES